MHKSDNKTTKQSFQDDIFQSHIMKQDPTKELQKFNKSCRLSRMARGDTSLNDHLNNNVQINFKVRPQKLKILNYEEQTQKKYGKQGILLKQSPNFFGGWQQRYCILKGNRFVYKQTKYSTSLNNGIINFNLLSCVVENLYQGTIFKISIYNSDKVFVFRGQNKQETIDWIVKLQKANANSQGYNRQFKYLTHYHRFWRKDYIGLKQFQKIVATGDVILFRGTKNTSVMQRALTGDQFDHVAVIIMNCKSQPLIFQADGRGVGICTWNQFVSKKFYATYDLIVHRHLNVNRNQQFAEIVDRFVSSNMGKQYDFSLKEYLFSRTSTNQGDKQAYFCSSLVAKLYKNLQLLDAGKSSTQYLPSWFSNKGGQLRKDGRFGLARFDDEKIIVFQNLLN